jgi:hypothetical protein
MPAFFDTLMLDREVAAIFQFDPLSDAAKAGALLDALDDAIDLDAREEELDADDDSAWLTNLGAQSIPRLPAQRRNEAAQRLRMSLTSFTEREVALAVLRHIAGPSDAR